MVTIRDIAKEAGVSPSTASRALNNNPHISKDTIDEIQGIADKLGYLPDYNAKNLTTGEASAVGVVFPVGGESITGNPFFINVLSGINIELIKRGYALSVAIAKTSEELKKNVKSMIYQSKIKRFVLLYSQENDPIAQFLRDNNLRFIVIGQPIKSNDYYVDNNNVDVGVGATEALLQKPSPSNITFVHSKENWIYEQQRYQGFQKVVKEKHIKFNEVAMNADDMDSLEDKIKSQPDVDGIIATDDLNAIGYFDEFHKIFPNKKPKLMGFNNSLPSILLKSNFQTVDLFPEQMGIKSVLLLFSDTEDPDIDKKRHLLVAYKII
ncbi:LacI family DNA-binding transcriptional regulator [Companilactobacillus mishanensis]|uniref:LacI family DNA-binding transcriptional regulator n=1 Tax=Companilactobacillus mishanensis TaxID=2486008 RepID=A0ABW9P5F5_9LACO|nr:LacI family DNA-binding transcriptional regulator [Companilactobacillus mishanensis]MQS44349.1 LacI family DNA-binding transcriptional regulator [Companilactobacillus mishanensis]